MWKLENEEGCVTLAEIKNFAEYQFCDMGDRDADVSIDPKYLPEGLESVAVIDPWIDQTGRFPLNDLEAQNEYSKEGVQDFILKANAFLEKHRLLIWDQGVDEKGRGWSIGMFKNTWETGDVSYNLYKSTEEESPMYALNRHSAEKEFENYVHQMSGRSVEISGQTETREAR